MRTVSWLFLILSFALGIGCAFIVRHYMFEAKPVSIADRGPTIKILVAKQTIPQGAEITAEFVSFVDVPIAELPSEATTNFSQVYRRRSAYPISAGCPICEDLLLPPQETSSETDKYVPAGMQIVSLEIEQILFSEKTAEYFIPITNYLAPDQRIDIRMLPTEKGELAERKKQLLKAFMSKNEVAEMGELLLENIKIQQIQSLPGNEKNGQRLNQTLTFVLEKEVAAQLIAAARKGRLRVVPHRQTSPALLAQTRTTTKETTPAEVIDKTTEPATEPTAEPITEPLKDTSLTEPISESNEPEATQLVPETAKKRLAFVPPEIPVAELFEKIRNEIHPVTALPSPVVAQEKTDLFITSTSTSTSSLAKPSTIDSKESKESKELVCHSSLSSSVIEIGLPVNRDALEENSTPKEIYNPWGQTSLFLIEPEPQPENEPDTLSQPLLRNRKKGTQP
ncbi:MAG: SAF domain-containing protein [Planctomycetaceae bacterium]|jgi:Flp pilus assembly protein CpaB|nr:SAF domain-containing protein [Planctomycetaceae bacterium]